MKKKKKKKERCGETEKKKLRVNNEYQRRQKSSRKGKCLETCRESKLPELLGHDGLCLAELCSSPLQQRRKNFKLGLVVQDYKVWNNVRIEEVMVSWTRTVYNVK